ncbi:MAG TPA: hypothetical protein VE988_14850 [Gemmataceae bacterium]|nr:hypothetical protein [Gemmataceae bacterium]
MSGRDTVASETIRDRPLNVDDCMLLSVDRALRRLGFPGFETQTLIWLARRVSVPDLRKALASLVQEFPTMTSRLLEPPQAARPCWRLRPGRDCTFTQTELISSNTECVLSHASRLLSTLCDPTENDPIRFHLLSRPNGKDVFVVHFNHALMDHNQVLGVLRSIDRYFGTDTAPPPPATSTDLVRGYLRRFSRQRKRAAIRVANQWRRLLRGGSVTLGKELGQNSGEKVLALAVRQLNAEQTAALEKSLHRIGGMPSLSMAMLGSAFRVIQRLVGNSANGKHFCTGIGVELGVNRAKGVGLQNLTSMVPVKISPEYLADPDEVTRILAGEIRNRLATEMDLGIVAGSALLNRWPWQANWFVEILLRYAVSLWYGYFGSMDSVGERFCGAAVEQIFSVGPAWAPAGLTLLVNKFHGCLHFQATYLPASVPEPLLQQFLDGLLDELIQRSA